MLQSQGIVTVEEMKQVSNSMVPTSHTSRQVQIAIKSLLADEDLPLICTTQCSIICIDLYVPDKLSLDILARSMPNCFTIDTLDPDLLFRIIDSHSWSIESLQDLVLLTLDAIAE